MLQFWGGAISLMALAYAIEHTIHLSDDDGRQFILHQPRPADKFVPSDIYDEDVEDLPFSQARWRGLLATPHGESSLSVEQPASL
ncbi:hypothetical protein IJJ12_00150 [bacterium]|nr:hypothetical protein [bacterium]